MTEINQNKDKEEQDKVQKQIILKLVLLGDAGVGKTSLVNMYTEYHFKEDYKPTLGVNIVVKEIEIEKIDAKIRLILWDIAGQNRYDLSRKMYFGGALGALFIYDTTRNSTFQNIEAKWLKDVKEFSEGEPAYILIGNKIDLEDSKVISMEAGKKLAEKINASDFVETSAKYGDNVEIAFKKLVDKVLTNRGVK
ncbi:hypothetical protein LCGC14_0745090 [marine sediment metagenome]|uniref:GTP-binding protein n=1 Tax=marine sediment metagenome TaxID=412755 RepID=A0A0F9Q5P5_9ZZZZ